MSNTLLTTEPAAVNIRDISPVLAVEGGYGLYLAQVTDANSPLGKSARFAAERFDQLLNAFPTDSKEGTYCLQVRLAANSLARGIERRKRTLEEAMRAIEEEKTAMVKRFAQTEGWWGILKGGAQIVSLGGFGYAIVHAIFAIPKLAIATAGMNEQYAALATAIGIALIGSFLKSQLMTRRLLKSFQRYGDAIRSAHAEYSSNVIDEYRLTAETANIAWRRLTGENPPPSSEFHALLIQNMSTPSRNGNAE